MRESEFTAPREDCPHPEWWTANDDQSAELEVTGLVAAFIRAIQPEYVVETGTATGQTAEAIGLALQANGHGRLDTLETDAECVKASTVRCAGLPVSVVHGSSLEFTPATEIGFAWFDSLLPLRAVEFERFSPWLPRGALVGFHDTGPHFGPGLRSDIAALAAARRLRPISLRTPRGVVFAQVL